MTKAQQQRIKGALDEAVKLDGHHAFRAFHEALDDADLVSFLRWAHKAMSER